MINLKAVAWLFLTNGLGYMERLFSYTLYKQRLDFAYQRLLKKGLRQAGEIPPGKLKQPQRLNRGAKFTFENAELEITFLAPDLARVSWEPGQAPLPYALAQTQWPEVSFSLEKEGSTWVLKSSCLGVYVGETGQIEYRLPDGAVLRQELPPLLEGRAWTHRARVQQEERFFGLGEQAGRLDLRGRSFRLWNTDPGGTYGSGSQPLYMPLPVYTGLHPSGSYLVFFENSYPADFSFPGQAATGGNEASRLAQAHFEGGLLRYYLIAGPVLKLLERYSELTGQAPLPPRWALGYHQSRWGYKNENDIRQVANGFKEHNLPVSAIHLDIDYMDNFRVFTVDSTRFPDLSRLSKDLEGRGIRLVTIINPGVKIDPEYVVFVEGLANSAFCRLWTKRPAKGVVWPGWSVFPDFTHPRIRKWWGEYYDRLLRKGIAGFWHDMNEPSSFSILPDKTLPVGTQHYLEGRSGDHLEAHNLYALLMNRAGFEALRQLQPDKRPWIVSRSGWASQQRYAWNWTGDTESTWEGLRATISTLLGMGLCGLPFTGPDIGGFSGDPPAELFLRSFQFATFVPFFRTHSSAGTFPREPWVFGDPYTRIIRKFLNLRLQLMPYLYSLAWEASQTGLPVLRPIYWANPQDQALWDIDDELFVGGSLLLAPILDGGLSERQVNLPPGSWYEYWDDRRVEGGGQMQVSTTLETIPLFVRGGSILPLEEGYGPLHLHIYAPGSGQESLPFQLYSDAGDGYGPSRIDVFSLVESNGQFRIKWEEQGEYPFAWTGIDLHLHGFPPEVEMKLERSAK